MNPYAKRRLVIAALALGTFLGFGSGFASLAHHAHRCHAGWHGWRGAPPNGAADPGGCESQ